MSEVTAAIFRGGKVIEHMALDTSVLRQRDSGFIWVEVLDPLDGDFDVLQERFGLPLRRERWWATFAAN